MVSDQISSFSQAFWKDKFTHHGCMSNKDYIQRHNGFSDLSGFSATQGVAPNKEPHLRLLEGIMIHTQTPPRTFPFLVIVCFIYE